MCSVICGKQVVIFPSMFFSKLSQTFFTSIFMTKMQSFSIPCFLSIRVDLNYFYPLFAYYSSGISQECLEGLEDGWLVGDPRFHGGRCQGWSIAGSFMGLATCNRESKRLGLDTSSLGRTNEVCGIPRGEGFCSKKNSCFWGLGE